jgi:hypothetical protein
VKAGREFARLFPLTVRADPELRSLARDARHLERNNDWAHGGPGPAERLAGWCTRPLRAPAWLLGRMLAGGGGRDRR